MDCKQRLQWEDWVSSYSFSFIIVSIVSGVIIVLLICLQTASFFTTKTSTTLTVQAQMEDAIPTKLAIRFVQMPCESNYHQTMINNSIRSSLRKCQGKTCQ